jgi:ribonuclease HI
VVDLKHVSAHVGIEGNELADRMAMLAVEKRETQWRELTGPFDIPALLKMRTG